MTSLIMVLGTITFYALILAGLALMSIGVTYAIYLAEDYFN